MTNPSAKMALRQYERSCIVRGKSTVPKSSMAVTEVLCFPIMGVKTDKGQFDEVLRRMLAKPPQKTSEIKGKEKAKPKPSGQK
jgi:hypothetical protein